MLKLGLKIKSLGVRLKRRKKAKELIYYRKIIQKLASSHYIKDRNKHLGLGVPKLVTPNNFISSSMTLNNDNIGTGCVPIAFATLLSKTQEEFDYNFEKYALLLKKRKGRGIHPAKVFWLAECYNHRNYFFDRVYFDPQKNPKFIWNLNNQYPKGKYIVLTHNHLTIMVDGLFIDSILLHKKDGVFAMWKLYERS